MDSRKTWTAALLSLILLILALTFYYFSPLFDGIVMGVVFAYVAKPVKKRLEFAGKYVSSLLATTFVIAPISILIFFAVFQGLNQAAYIITHYKVFEEELILILKNLGVEENVEEFVRQIFPSAISLVQSTFQISAVEITKKLSLFAINFIISVIVCFYALTDSERFIERTIKIVPEDVRDEFRQFIKELDETYLALWFGNFIVAMMIGLASLPFFIYFHVPFAPLLSGLMFLAALIPIFAEWMVILPVSLYLFLHDPQTALVFLATGVVFLYIIPELIIRPQFLGYRSKIHPLVLLLAFVGGGIVGGIGGFFLAPMIAGLATAIYNYYTR